MPSSPLTLTADEARRLQRRLVLLDAPAESVAAALAHHAYIQIDPINVCGRMHDLILRNRVAGYREGDLMRHLHGVEALLPASQRTAFDLARSPAHSQPRTIPCPAQSFFPAWESPKTRASSSCMATFNLFACSFRCMTSLALSSALAALDWVTLSIWAMARFT